MELNENMKKLIAKKLASCEQLYGVTVLFWSFRGSLDIGISRKNSDLDLIFVFKNRTENKVAAIHDIVGYGFDFWGWDIDDAIKTITINNDAFYKDHIGYRNLPLTKEHARGGLTYYSGIYCYIGNVKSGSNIQDIDGLCGRLMGVMEKRVLVSHILAGVEEELNKLEINGGMSACDYLYITWRVLLAEHVCRDGLPGESEIDPLMKLYMDGKTADVVNKLRRIYKNSLSKHTQFFKIGELNEFIRDKFMFLKKIEKELPVQHEDVLIDRLNDLKLYINELKI